MIATDSDKCSLHPHAIRYLHAQLNIVAKRQLRRAQLASEVESVIRQRGLPAYEIESWE